MGHGRLNQISVTYDRDGFTELCMCHGERGFGGTPFNKDRLYHNLGNGTFEDVTDAVGLVPVSLALSSLPEHQCA